MKQIKFLLPLTALLISLACGLISNPIENLSNEAVQLATEVGGTVQSFATEVPVGEIKETVQAFATESPQDLESLQATAKALQESVQNPVVPEDIPVFGSDNQNFFANESLVSYMTAGGFNVVLDFYQKEMPNNGWEELTSENLIAGETAILHFEKANRKAVVSLSINPLDQKTVVLISISEQ